MDRPPRRVRVAHDPAAEGETVTVPFLSNAEPAIGVLQEPNVAITDFAASIVTVQVVLVPEHAPVQPVNPPEVAAAVSVTVVPLA